MYKTDRIVYGWLARRSWGCYCGQLNYPDAENCELCRRSHAEGTALREAEREQLRTARLNHKESDESFRD